MNGPQLTPPDLQRLETPEGCLAVEMPLSLLDGASFIEGDPEGLRLRVRMFVRESDKRMIAKVWFGPHAEGPPGHAHGGASAAVLDHAMGVGTWLAGYPVLSARITIDYHHKVPLGHVLTVESWVEEVAGKKVSAKGRLFGDDPNRCYTTGSGLFILQRLENLAPVQGHGERLRSHMVGDPVERDEE